MKIYIFLFLLPFWASAQQNNKPVEKTQAQSTNKFQAEIFTFKTFPASATTVSSSNTFNKDLADADQSTKLDTVLLKTKGNFRTKDYGFLHQNFFRSLFYSYTYNFSKGEYNHRIGVYIAPPETGKPAFITEVLLRAWSQNQSSPATLRVHLYPFDREKKIIGQDLLKKVHRLQLDAKRSLKTIDVRDEHLPFPKTGLLIAVEKIDDPGAPTVQMKKSKSGNSNSYYIPKNMRFVSGDSLLMTPLGGINKNMLEKLGEEQTDFMLGVSVKIAK